MLTFLLTEQILLAYILLPELRKRFWTLMMFLTIIAMTCLATSTHRPDVLGGWSGGPPRRWSYLPHLAGPLRAARGAGGISRGSRSVTKEQLAGLTVTSPFSAALGVPDALDPERGLESTKPLAVARIRPGSDQRDVALPVWAIFLCIYPPLCLIFCG